MKIKTLLIAIFSLVLVSAIAMGVFFTLQMKKDYEAKLADKDMTIMSLQAEIDSIGQMTIVYQTAYNVRSGTEVKEEDLVPIEVPAKVAEQYIQDTQEIVGNFYMIDITAGTPLVSSMFLPFKLEKDMRYLDVVVSETPIGIGVDDYVDVRIAFEDGEDFLCMSNKRVAGVYGKVIKLIVNEKDIHVYESMKVDAACRRQNLDEKSKNKRGEFINRIYAIKYVEGGAQEEGSKYYPIRDAGTEILLRDPNVDGDLSYLYNEDTAQMRKILDKKYVVTSEDIKAYKKELIKVYGDAEKEYKQMVEQQMKAAAKVAEQAAKEARKNKTTGTGNGTN